MLHIGIVIFPQVEELDFVAPFEVLSYMNKIQPNSTRVLLIAPSLEPIEAFNGLKIIPHESYKTAPSLDILIFPGGKGRIRWMKDASTLAFLHRQYPSLSYLASVCTGAFFLAEAGLLQGKKATTHAKAFNELADYGIQVVSSKIVREGKIISAGGVSSGLELGFYLLKELFGTQAAREVAENIEYTVDIDAL
ncbi:MAG: DJ-1/PfpI family protein [Epsilonproteobacteria bacterium]|nr:DJ-1/PfpI family protein [Campylobacterota bacterium]